MEIVKNLLDQPDIRPVKVVGIKMDRFYRLHRDYVYVWEKEGRIFSISVREGFIYDGLSVPRIGWSVSGLRPDGLGRAGGLIHDEIYRKGGKGCDLRLKDADNMWQENKEPIRRKDADRLFCRILRESGVEKGPRRTMYRMVRLFGKFHFGKPCPALRGKK